MFNKTFIILFAAFLLIGSMAATSQAAWTNAAAVSPPATYSGDGTNGTPRTISGVVPGDFKENEQENIGYGTFSNRLFCKGNNHVNYRVKIQLTTPLTAGINTISTSALKYLLTYTNGSGEVLNNKYTEFSASPVDVYYSTSDECGPAPTGGNNTGMEREFQFKYAIQVPNNQAPGAYTGTITYTMAEDGGGATITRTTDITVTVGTYFRLSVDRGSVDFDKMKPGETKDNVPPEGVIVTSMTNDGNPWYLKISNDGPLSSGPYVIPNTNLIWYGWTDGTGTWYGTGTNPVDIVPDLMYGSGATEVNNLPNGTNNHLKFKLTVPKGQPGGKYLSNIKLTLTE